MEYVPAVGPGLARHDLMRSLPIRKSDTIRKREGWKWAVEATSPVHYALRCELPPHSWYNTNLIFFLTSPSISCFDSRL